MNRIFVCFLLFLVFLMSGCSDRTDDYDIGDKAENRPAENTSQAEKEVEKDRDSIQEIMDKMTLDEKIGQLIIVGLNGPSMDNHTIDMIRKHYVGGFILFKYNISDETQTVDLINSLKKVNSINSIPLFLSIDEEGGRVTRLPNSFLRIPAAKNIGDINDKGISLEYGTIIGDRLASLGLNMNFGPVLDIDSNPENPVIGDRAFGATDEIVIDNGIQTMQGMRSRNIISVVKHFPGHGDTDLDPHVDLPLVDKGLEDLEKQELLPFIAGIEGNVDGIMVGHMLFPQLDKENPATLSEVIIGKLLRERLNYKGLIVSDDMTMGAIIKNYTIDEAAIKFLKAGGDILLICHGYENPIQIIERIKEELNKGNISSEEIDRKVYRIISTKEKYQLEDELIDKINIELLNSKTKKLLDKII